MSLAKWEFDLAHSSVNFTVRHLIVSKVRGRFTKWSGSLKFDPKNPAASSVEVQIDAASIDTADAQRDTHLRSADFFEVEKFPRLSFKSTRVEKDGDHFKVAGDLTIHGVSKPVVLLVEYGGQVKDPWGKDRVGFTASTSIDRKDFGLTWNQVLDLGGVAVGEKVDISLDLEATKVIVAEVLQAVSP